MSLTGWVETESGAVYSFQGGRVRRENSAHEKRADGEWLRLKSVYPPRPIVGEPMVLTVESLAWRGPDDFGIPRILADEFTTRHTTRLVRVQLD